MPVDDDIEGIDTHCWEDFGHLVLVCTFKLYSHGSMSLGTGAAVEFQVFFVGRLGFEGSSAFRGVCRLRTGSFQGGAVP